MKDKKKKPDLVVWDEERGYYPRELTYGSNLGAPAIQMEDVGGWRQSNVQNVNQQFRSRYEELKEAAAKLMDEYNWNDLIYTRVDYSFQPTVGHDYHLYMRADDSLFLSIIKPNEWGMKHIASFRLDSTNKWNKI
jgi:hypothetical protein